MSPVDFLGGALIGWLAIMVVVGVCIFVCSCIGEWLDYRRWKQRRLRRGLPWPPR